MTASLVNLVGEEDKPPFVPDRAPLVELIVGASHSRVLALGQNEVGDALTRRILALIDTGASHTVMHPSGFSTLRIPSVPSSTLQTASTGERPERVKACDVRVILLGNGRVEDGLVVPSLHVTESQLDVTQGFHALLGRDILSQCVLTDNGAQG